MKQRGDNLRGFTLVELLVVVLVMGIMLGLVQLAVTPNPERVLARDAERLALTLSAAQAQSAATGRAMRLEAIPNGWRFLQRGRSETEAEVLLWTAIEADEVFGPRRFETEGAALMLPAGGVALGLEPISTPLSLAVKTERSVRFVVSDGAGGFRVEIAQ